MTDIPAAAAATFAIVDRAKQALSLAQKLKDVELQGVVLAVREEAISLTEEVLRLRGENLTLRQRLEDREDVASLIHDQNVYWRVVDGRRIGPFCPACRHLDLPKVVPMSEDVDVWICPSCKHKQDTPQRLRDRRSPIQVTDYDPGY